MTTDDYGAVKARLDAVDSHVKEIDKKVDHLIVAEAERRGREQREERNVDYRHDDRWQVWLRTLIPTGIFAGIWTWIMQVWNGQ
jgi:hypothetical protein